MSGPGEPMRANPWTVVLLQRVDAWIGHSRSCQDDECQTCDVLFNQVVRAQTARENSQHKAGEPTRAKVADGRVPSAWTEFGDGHDYSRTGKHDPLSCRPCLRHVIAKLEEPIRSRMQDAFFAGVTRANDPRPVHENFDEWAGAPTVEQAKTAHVNLATEARCPDCGALYPHHANNACEGTHVAMVGEPAKAAPRKALDGVRWVRVSEPMVEYLRDESAPVTIRVIELGGDEIEGNYILDSLDGLT